MKKYTFMEKVWCIGFIILFIAYLSHVHVIVTRHKATLFSKDSLITLLKEQDHRIIPLGWMNEKGETFYFADTLKKD